MLARSHSHSLSHARFNCAPCSCYVCVHFAIFWCSCQVFSLDKSFNTLFNDHRTGKESCLQLLGYLKTKTRRIKLKLYKQLFKEFSNNMFKCGWTFFGYLNYLKLSLHTSATRTLCCIFFLDFMIRTIAASISCFLSSSTFCRVSFLSGSDSPCLAATAEMRYTGYRKTLSKWLTSRTVEK